MDLRFSYPLLELKAAERAGVIEGLASTWGGPPDLHGDVFQPGAFLDTLAEHKAAGTMPAMLWGHSQSEPIGRWQEIIEDDSGLYVRGQLTMSVQKAQEAYALAQDDALGLSVGFRPIRQKAMKGANLIESVYLGEISLVGLAANPKARITSCKSLDGINSAAEYQSFLRELGLSVREAKRLARGGWSAFQGEGADASDIAEILKASANQFKGTMK